MRSLQYIAGICTVLMLASCDYVTNPTDQKPSSTSSTSGGNGNTVVRKVLVEDYTGQECGNCPRAAEKGATLTSLYGENVVIMAVHAGYFAEPAAAPFDNDYRTTAGDDWDTFFGISSAGNPNGMINRKDYPAGNHIKGITTWTSETAPFIGTAAAAKLELMANYNTGSRILNLDVKTKFISALSSTYKLSVVILEDSIVSAQKDYSLNPSVITNYTQRHMLRGSVNGSWGDVLNTAAVAAGDSVLKSYNNFSINSAFNDQHVYVVAFIYDSQTREVIQVEETKLR